MGEPAWQKPLRWWAPWRTWAVRREWERQALIVCWTGKWGRDGDD